MNRIYIKQNARRLIVLFLTLLVVAQSVASVDHVHTSIQDESLCDLCAHNHLDDVLPTVRLELNLPVTRQVVTNVVITPVTTRLTPQKARAPPVEI